MKILGRDAEQYPDITNQKAPVFDRVRETVRQICADKGDYDRFKWPRCNGLTWTHLATRGASYDGLRWPHPSVGIIDSFPVVEVRDESTRGGICSDP